MMPFLRDRKVRDIFWQAAATIVLIALVWFFVRNASANMVKAGIASGFQFLWRDSGIEVPFNLTGYRPSDDILALLWTGIVNTLLVSAVSIVVATALGFTVGLLRLSRNWLLSTLAGAYVEFVRNIPLLFFVLFWYFGVLALLPAPRESLAFHDLVFLNRRGLSIPLPDDLTGFRIALLATVLLFAAQWGLARWARARQARTGRDFPTWAVGFVLCAALAVAIYGRLASSPTILLLTGPLVGFFGHGYFSVFGVMLAEFFPTGIRATAQGLCYNAGRGISALAPMTIGAIAGRSGIGVALACTSVFYLVGAMLIYLLPETRGRVLE